LKPHFAEAAALLAGNTSCGFIDGAAERVLQTRLGVRGYPSIYLFRDGVTRSYAGSRTAGALVSWAKQEYVDSPAAPWHKTPNNALGRALGRLLRLPAAAGRAWTRVRQASGMGDASLAGCAALGTLLFAAAAIWALDAAVSLSGPVARPHAA
jgi:hypothetical protein